VVDGEEIAIFHLEDRYLTIEISAPQGRSLVRRHRIGQRRCVPLHGRRFDLETGMAVRASEPSGVATFPTRVQGGIIFVDLSGRKSQEETAA